MNMMLRALAVSLTLLALAACTTVTTVNPIGIAKGDVKDERLLGTWNFRPTDAAAKNETAYTFILSREQGGFAGLIVIPGENEWWEAELIAGKAGDYGMLNVKPLKKNGEPVDGSDRTNGYFPLRYEARADGKIQLFMWSNDALKEAVEKGQIAGTMDTGQITLTAEPAELDAFFANSAPAMFPVPYATLERTP